MQSFKLLLTALCVALLTACSSVETVKDFENRSVAYGWVDVKDVDINRVDLIYIKQYRPKAEVPYFQTAFKEFKGGYMFWTVALPNGSHKLDTIMGHACLAAFLCGNTEHVYNFGTQGDEVGAVVIGNPGVYYLGSYKMANEKTGFFERGKFKVSAAANAPTRRELLQAILNDKELAENPVMRERIQRELAHL